MNHYDVVIVGAGMSGLTMAYHLEKFGYNIAIFEAGSAVGGRVRTDNVDGFQLDRGLHFFQSSYPEAAKVLEYKSLRLKNIYPGMLIYHDEKFDLLSNPLIKWTDIFTNFFGNFHDLSDRMKFMGLLAKLSAFSESYILNSKDIDAYTFIQQQGFSKPFIEKVFRPFMGAIFCSKDMHVSSRLFCYVLKYFTISQLALPEKGIGSIPQNIVSQLKSTTIFLNTKVKEAHEDGVMLANGDYVQADRVVIATTPCDILKILPQHEEYAQYKHVSCLYFSAYSTPLKESIVAFNGSGKGIVNHIFVPTNLHKSYAPKGQHLIGVSIVDIPELDDDELIDQVISEMVGWFGVKANSWTHLKTYHIRNALPDIKKLTNIETHKKTAENIYIIGDHTSFGSINMVMQNSRLTAKSLHKELSTAKRQPATAL